jgi:hypothetical protein
VYPGLAGNILQLQRAGLFLYRTADAVNRGVSYLAGRKSIRKWEHLIREGRWEEFLYRTGMINESKTLTRRMRKMAKNASPESWDSVVDKMGHDYGVHLSEQTQYIYNRVNAPKLFQGVLGRMFGQFNLWPVGYGEYIWRNTHGIPGLNILKKNAGLKERFAHNFLLKTLAMRTAMMGLGAYTGINMASWNFSNPLSIEGGPYFQVLRDVITLAAGGDEYQVRAAKSGLKRFLVTGPFAGQGQDVSQFMEEPDPLISLALLLSFNIKTTKDRQRESKRQ